MELDGIVAVTLGKITAEVKRARKQCTKGV